MLLFLGSLSYVVTNCYIDSDDIFLSILVLNKNNT